MKKVFLKSGKHIGICLLFLLSLIILPAAAYSAPKTVNYGVACALSGSGAVYGLDFVRAMQVAAAEINEKGGFTVGGEKYKINVISYDTELKPALSIKMALRLSSLDKCPAVFVAESTGALAVMKYNEKEKFILMAVTTTPQFTEMGNKLAVRISTAFSKHVDNMTEEAWKKGIRKVGILVRGFETSKRWAAHFETVWQKKGGQIVAREESPLSSNDHYSRLTKIMSANPDAILVPSFSDEPAALVVKQARELGFKGRFMFTEAMEGDQIISMVPAKDLEGSLLVNGSSALKRPEFLAFRERYKAKFPDAIFQPAGPAGYEGVYIMALAMEKAGTVSDVNKIRAAMPSVVPVPDKYRAAGFTKIDPDGDMSAGSVLTEFKNGKKEILKIKK